MEACSLCRRDLGPLVATSAYWQLIVNHNQNLLGKCFWALRRHLEAVPALTAAEWHDLHTQLAATTQALAVAFQPDHFNYAFLQNQDRHIHLHIIPRYATPRTFGDLVFDDPDYPSHYAVPGPVRRLAPEALDRLATVIRQRMITAGV